MTQFNVQFVVSLFNLPSKTSKKKVKRLVQQSFAILGQSESLTLIRQWEKLSTKLKNLNQMQCLSDKNHRLLLIYFIKDEAIDHYNNSYFNHAKIANDYISFLKQFGSFHFAEIIKVVSKLKLISKHYYHRLYKKTFGQNLIDIKIMKLLEMCSSHKRKGNSNLNKFQAVVEFEDDRNESTKQLGKMLRISWVLQKKELFDPQIKPIIVESKKSKILLMIFNPQRNKRFCDKILARVNSFIDVNVEKIDFYQFNDLLMFDIEQCQLKG